VVGLLSLVGFAGAEVQEKKLTIVVSSNDDPFKPELELKGHYIFISDGKKLEKPISLKGGNAWSEHGEYFEEVILQNVGTGGSFQIWVVEAGEPVFSTGLVRHHDPVVYNVSN